VALILPQSPLLLRNLQTSSQQLWFTSITLRVNSTPEAPTFKGFTLALARLGISVCPCLIVLGLTGWSNRGKHDSVLIGNTLHGIRKTFPAQI
jgi:hypothetical protein